MVIISTFQVLRLRVYYPKNCGLLKRRSNIGVLFFPLHGLCPFSQTIFSKSAIYVCCVCIAYLLLNHDTSYRKSLHCIRQSRLFLQNEMGTHEVFILATCSKPNSAMDSSRMATLRTFPETVIGKPSTNFQYFGIL